MMPMQAERPPILKIVSQHAEGAAFEWLLRDAAVESAHHNLVQLSRIDERVSAHLDGLLVAKDAGWDACMEGLAWKEPGEIFAAAWMALSTTPAERIERVIELALTRADLLRAFVSALGWMEWGYVAGRARDWMESDDSRLRELGLSAAAVHRRLSRSELGRALEDEDQGVRRRAMKAVGEMGESCFLPQLRHAMLSKDEAERFQAAWSGCLLGDSSFTSELCLQARAPTVEAEQACLLAVRSMNHEDSFRWLAAFAKNGGDTRVLVKGMGASGDASHLPALLEMMEDAVWSRLAGESFTFITGLDLAEEGMEGQAPEGYNAGPNDDPEDENVAGDPDEGLPWPLATEVARWWHGSPPSPAGRRFLGKAPLTDHLRTVLRTGTQRQRAAAALELALREPGKILYNTAAPGVRQGSAFT
jgi:uncharacterized protein (TIGR02270 family)